MNFIKTTEQDSNYNHLEKMSVQELLTNINSEDKSIPLAVEKIIPSKIAHFEPKNAHSSINLKLNRAFSQNQRPIGNIVPWISRSQMT